jgi:hypothetical protein
VYKAIVPACEETEPTGTNEEKIWDVNNVDASRCEYCEYTHWSKNLFQSFGSSMSGSMFARLEVILSKSVSGGEIGEETAVESVVGEGDKL